VHAYDHEGVHGEHLVRSKYPHDHEGTTVTWQNADGVGHTTTSNPANPTACPTWDNTVAAGATAPGYYVEG